MSRIRTHTATPRDFPIQKTARSELARNARFFIRRPWSSVRYALPYLTHTHTQTRTVAESLDIAPTFATQDSFGEDAARVHARACTCNIQRHRSTFPSNDIEFNVYVTACRRKKKFRDVSNRSMPPQQSNGKCVALS